MMQGRFSRSRRLALGAAIVACATFGVARDATSRIAGGHGKRGDCYAEFDGVTSTKSSGQPRVDCVDGDPTCDTDGACQGTCTFVVSECINQTDINGCTPPTGGLKNIKVTPRKFKSLVSGLDLTQAVCGSPLSITVKTRGKRPGTQKVTVTAKGQKGAKPANDIDVVTLACKPRPAGQACPAGSGVPKACPTDPANCKNNTNGGPREIKLTSGATGTDLDNGVTGTSHNFPVTANSVLRLCLAAPDDKPAGCNGTDDPNCVACGATGPGSMNTATFGAPLPLFAASVPVCVVNRFADSYVQGTVNVQTGVFDAKVGSKATPIHLSSDVFLTNPLQVCPRCINGKCNSGAKQGQSCTINGSVTVNNPPQAVNDHYDLSSDCPPLQSDFQATLDIGLPLTTDTSSISGSKPCPGQTRDDDCGSIGSVCNTPCGGVAAAKGGINQVCCGDGKTPCFPTSAASGIGKIERSGQPDPPAPVWPAPTYPKVSSNGKLAAVFCEAKTNSPSIDTTSGLPGPGALILTGKQCLIGNNGTDCP